MTAVALVIFVICHIASDLIQWIDEKIDEVDEVNLNKGLFGMPLHQFEKLSFTGKLRYKSIY